MSDIHQKINCPESPDPSSCFFCTMNEPSPCLRRSKLIQCFKEMPQRDDQEHVLALSGLWTIAMKQPNNPEFPSLGVLECMGRLIQRAVGDPKWLLSHQNIYIPYYAAHVIGSYTMNKAKFAEKAVKSGVVSPLLELLRGKISWVEKRVAVRALGHMACHDRSFEAIIHEREIVELAMEIASTCVEEVYDEFVCVKESKRLKYHCNLLTRGLGGLEIENRKAEEWASQTQCWSLYLLNCFACRERFLSLICDKEFMKKLCGMWGGLVNPKSPAGIGLIRTLCNTKIGRQSLADLEQVMEVICNLTRSSDDWQIMAIECILLLLKDPEIRYKVIDTAVLFLGDLVELGSREIAETPKVGERITQTLLQDYHRIKFGKLRLKSEKAEKMLEEIWDLKVDRKRREKLMPEDEIRERKLLVGKLKKQGNLHFWSGDIEKALVNYSEALCFCPLKRRKERIVLHSNRAQCHLLLRDPESAISDTTRALCLSSAASPHGKSLWRRSQAYDMKGLARESLMDCLMFVKGRIKSDEKSKPGRIPYYAARMINKQMNATWIFAPPRLRSCYQGEDKVRKTDGHDNVDEMMMKTNYPRRESVNGEPLVEKPWRRRKLQMAALGRKELHLQHQIGSWAHVRKDKNLESSLNV